MFSRFFLRSRPSSQDCCDRKVLEAALDSHTLGKIMFNAEGLMVYANAVAYGFVPALKGAGADGKGFRLPHFIDYLFDHAADVDVSLKNALGEGSGANSIINFREVVALEGGALCVVEAKPLVESYTLFVMTDISRDRQREESLLYLNENNYRLQKAIQFATNGLVVSDPKVEGNPFIFVNGAFCDFFGLKPEQMIGKSWDILPDITRNEKIATSLIQAVVVGKDAEIEFSVKNAQETRWFALKLSAVKDSAGRVDLFVGVFTDTTKLMLREAEAYQGQKLEALGKLAGGVAHDFNNILSIIDGFSIMAAKGLDPQSEAAQYLLKIQGAAKRGAALTNKMLTFSRHKVVSRNVFDLSALLEDQKILLDPLVPASVRFSVRASEPDLRVSGTQDAIAQILMNLVVNARDAMPGGGTLSVDLRGCGRSELPEKVKNRTQEKRFAKLTVSDTGTGIEPKVLEKIFDPFFTTKPQGKGTGLGLSIVYGLVREMDGGVSVASRVGEGTAITVFLPLSEAPVSKVLSGTVRDPATLKLKGYTILVAEDEPELLQIVCEMLEKMEATVLRASNGNEALVVQDDYEGDVDLLLSDVMMPEMNGVKLATLLCSLRPETKVVFMSGYPGSGEMAPVEVPETAIFIPKPVDYNRLVLTLFETLNNNFPDAASNTPDEVKPHWVSTSDQVH